MRVAVAFRAPIPPLMMVEEGIGSVSVKRDVTFMVMRP